jgi:hypothetical protein
MKKLMLLFSAIVAVLVMATAIASEDFYFYVHYDEQVSEQNNEPVDIYYRVTNVGDDRSDDLSVKIYIPELDVYETSQNFDLSRDDSYSGFMSLDLPEDVSNGEYLVRFTVSNDDQKKVTHRYIIVG